jgi:uncharacterized protein YutE (UPF0331/DUF86 family)
MTQTYSRKFDTIEECLKKLNTLKDSNTTFEVYLKAWKDRDAVERNLQKVIEALIDIGKMVIAEKGLRAPGNSRETFEILMEHDMLPPELMPLIDKMVGMRNILVNSYDKVDDAVVYAVLTKHLTDISNLTQHLKMAAFE